MLPKQKGGYGIRPYKIEQNKSWTHHKRIFVRDVSDVFSEIRIVREDFSS